MFTNINLSDRLYYRFSELVYDNAGISLGDAKRELVRSRLLKRLRALKIATFEDYYTLISKHDSKGEELARMLDAISTNKTDFFRENQHFIFLTESVLPGLIDKAKRDKSSRIRIWSAGCSSGEEPYTLAMILKDMLDNTLLSNARILATDISLQMLQVAKEGLYEESKVQPVPVKMRLGNFTKKKTPKGNFYHAKPDLKNLIAFRKLNLMKKTYPFKGKFNVIFCRNVMIYFDRKTQEELVNRFYQYLHPEGYLFIGHSESLNAIKTPFRFVKPTIYLRP